MKGFIIYHGDNGAIGDLCFNIRDIFEANLNVIIEVFV